MQTTREHNLNLKWTAGDPPWYSLVLTMTSSSIRAASRSENTICLPRTLLRLRAGTSSAGPFTRCGCRGANDLVNTISGADPALECVRCAAQERVCWRSG